MAALKSRIIKSLVISLLCVPVVTLAGVNLKNGNFYITYADISLANADHPLELNRTYNSKAARVGWFGAGWGSSFETRLVVLPDGSAVVQENGSGRSTYYRVNDANSIKAGVQRIVRVAAEREKLSTTDADKLATQLLGDEELRLQKVERYGIKTELKPGAALDDFCGKATLTRIAEGYLRKDCGRFLGSQAATDVFDLQGRLIKHELGDGYAINVNYAANNTTEISDTLGQKITLTTVPEGRVIKAKTEKDEVVYSYQDNHALTKAVYATGLAYDYSYDRNDNLTRITYIDNTSMFISYSPRVNGMVDSVTQRNGDQETYVYRTDKDNPNHYWTKWTSITAAGETSSREYEFENETSPLGVTELAKTGVVDGYHAQETQFDQKGRVVRKMQDGVVLEYVYHPKNGKISKVIRDGQKTEFSYDRHNNLLWVKNSEGQRITLKYDHKAHIRRVIMGKPGDADRKNLRFTYNPAGKISTIRMIGKGLIEVSYDPSGEISEVNSKQGAMMALQVTTAFQDLLQAVKVADIQF